MKILIIHRNFFIDGGDSNYTIKLAYLLQSKGHSVSILTISDYRNLKKDFKVYEIPNFFSKSKHSHIYELYFIDKIKYTINSVFSLTSYKYLRKILRQEKFDIIHIQNIHHVITPSILLAIKKAGIPVVWTLHDYKLICPSSNFFTKGSICEKCNGGKYYYCLINRCKRNSFWGSSIIMISAYIDKILRLYKIPNIFITPSNFLKVKLIQNGFKSEKVVNIPNYIEIENEKINMDYMNNSNKILFYGNLSKEKGVDLIIEIAKKKQDIQFQIIGSGPLAEMVVQSTKDYNNISYINFLEKTEIFKKIKCSKFVIVPSQWYENFPFTILEPISLGKTVIASNVGGIPEIIKDNFNGLLVKQFNSVDEWSDKITELYYDEIKINTLEKNALKSADKYNKEEHYQNLSNIYNCLLG